MLSAGITFGVIMDKAFLNKYLNKFCATNIDSVKKPIKGVVLRFHGLSHSPNLERDMACSPVCSENSILYVYVFYNPWAWMNKDALVFVNGVLDCIFENENLPSDLPIGIFGSSMGGYSAFEYARNGKYKISAILANCPLCDIEDGVYKANNNLLKTYFYSAITSCDDFDGYMREHSPLRNATTLPHIPYHFVIGLRDNVLPPNIHGKAMVIKMREAGYDVSETLLDEVGHCNLSFEQNSKAHSWLCDKILEA